MRKTDKKIDKQLRDTLTELCESTLKSFDGFLWVTHIVNFSNFPQSLKVVCVFETNQQLVNFTDSQDSKAFAQLMAQRLLQVGIQLKKVEKHLFFDSQENCDRDDQGKWERRLK
ncbi:Fis family transcriptional regulator [Vibrio profundi]|uniref:Fis family transcriptional regulator n=1 Tax=Vibrio profundi TaxID=1774960 RepID=UPI00373554E6